MSNNDKLNSKSKIEVFDSFHHIKSLGRVEDTESVDFTKEEEKHVRYEPPEFGGFGWLVCMGAAFVNVRIPQKVIFNFYGGYKNIFLQSFNFSLTFVYGLLFGLYLRSRFKSTSYAVLVLNSNILVINLLGGRHVHYSKVEI